VPYRQESAYKPHKLFFRYYTNQIIIGRFVISIFLNKMDIILLQEV